MENKNIIESKSF